MSPNPYTTSKHPAPGDTIRFDHSDTEFEFVSFDRDSGVLTVATPGSQGNPLLTKSEQAADLVKYRVSENGIEKINDKAEGARNGRENENGAAEAGAGDEGGAKGERGKHGEGDGKESAADGGAAEEVAAGERGRGGAVGEGAKIENSQGYRDWLKANGKNDNASMRRAYANEAVRKLTDLFDKAFRSMGFGEGEGKREGLKFSFVDRIEDAKSGGANEVRFARRAPRGDAIESNIRQMLKHGKVYDTEDSLHFAYSAEQNEIAFFRDNGDLTFDITRLCQFAD